jgi:hypothetical protein
LKVVLKVVMKVVEMVAKMVEYLVDLLAARSAGSLVAQSDFELAVKKADLSVDCLVVLTAGYSADQMVYRWVDH